MVRGRKNYDVPKFVVTNHVISVQCLHSAAYSAFPEKCYFYTCMCLSQNILKNTKYRNEKFTKNFAVRLSKSDFSP